MSSTRMRVRGHPYSRLLAGFGIVALAVVIVAAAPLVASSVDGEYRAESAVYNQEGFTYAEPILPFTERSYRAEIGSYDEEGFGYLKPSLPYTERAYRGQHEAYIEEGHGYLR